MKTDLYQIIKRPLVTEKVMFNQGVKNVYVFEVNPLSTKGDIKKAVEKLFEVDVLSINTSVVRGKKKRVGRVVGKKSNWKKAWVTLKNDNKIDLFEGV